MTEHLRLIQKKLTHLQRMRRYLVYSVQRFESILPITDWDELSLEQHEILAAFRIRFSEFQEHLAKCMKAIAIEEEVDVQRFGAVLSFMEKLNILESVERWKIIRELRNAVNHEYEDDAERLAQFFEEMLKAAPELFDCHQKLLRFCEEAYEIKLA